MISEIYIPTRLQIDTLIAIFLVQEYGTDVFGTIYADNIVLKSVSDVSSKQLLEQNILPLDTADWELDHHNKEPKTWLSFLVAKYLHIENNPEIQKLLAFSKRDDMFGKGCISADPLDKAFCLPGLLSNLNKDFASNPTYIYGLLSPIIKSHWNEEKRRTIEMPTEILELEKSNKLIKFEATQKSKKYKSVIDEYTILTTDFTTVQKTCARSPVSEKCG